MPAAEVEKKSPALYNQVRPTRLEDVVGQDSAIAVLQEQVKRSAADRAHAILLTGFTGSGKTTVARIIAKMYGCKRRDYREVNAASQRGIDDMRQLISHIPMRPLSGTCRIDLLDEAHHLTTDAQTSLLKPLEDPPEHYYLILCTTHPQKLIPTVKNRCLEVVMKPIAIQHMEKLVLSTATTVGIKLAESVVDMIVNVADGSARRAIMLLDKVRTLTDKDAQLAALGEADCKTKAYEIFQHLIKGNWSGLSKVLKDLENEEIEGIRHMVLACCATAMMNNNPRAFSIACEFKEPFYNSGRPGLVLACYAATH